MSRVVLSADYATSGVMRFFATRATARVAKQKRNNATSGHNAQNHEWHSCIFATSVIMERYIMRIIHRGALFCVGARSFFHTSDIICI